MQRSIKPVELQPAEQNNTFMYNSENKESRRLERNSGVTRLQWARVQVFQKGPLFPKKLKKQRRANFGPPTALGPRALHALHALLLRHWNEIVTVTAQCRYHNLQITRIRVQMFKCLHNMYDAFWIPVVTLSTCVQSSWSPVSSTSS